MNGDYWGKVFETFWGMLAVFAISGVIVFVLIIAIGAVLDARDKLRYKGYHKWALALPLVALVVGLSIFAFGVGIVAATGVLDS